MQLEKIRPSPRKDNWSTTVTATLVSPMAETTAMKMHQQYDQRTPHAHRFSVGEVTVSNHSPLSAEGGCRRGVSDRFRAAHGYPAYLPDPRGVKR